MLNGPILITTTKHIRKRPPFKCSEGDQAAHSVGLNLAKLLLNYYSTERDIVVNEDVIAQLITDINDESNLECATKEANTQDKYTEEEVLDLLFHGTKTFDAMSQDAKTMLERLLYLLKIMINHLKLKNQHSAELQLIHDEIEKRDFPLSRHCLECNIQCLIGPENGFASFCNFSCQVSYFDKSNAVLSTNVLLGKTLEEGRLFVNENQVFAIEDNRYRVTELGVVERNGIYLPAFKEIRNRKGRMRLGVSTYNNIIVAIGSIG